MPKSYSSRHIIKVLLKHGFYFVSQKGSHAKYRKDSNPVPTVIVPAERKEIPYGTFRSIVRQSGLKENDFA
ncbi:MAG: type II toxin-antitoxin system HicA family toxin [Bacteroidia bacterium]